MVEYWDAYLVWVVCNQLFRCGFIHRNRAGIIGGVHCGVPGVRKVSFESALLYSVFITTKILS